LRFRADENIPGVAVRALEQAGHDVVWIRISNPGASDIDVLGQAAREARILLTFDKDFGELTQGKDGSQAYGVILFRPPMRGPTNIASSLLNVISSRDDWAGHFSVVEPGRIRMRPIGP
jgi:hypothetical protein